MLKKPLLVFGTRPEALKLAPLILSMQRAPDFEPIVAVTGQHRVMLDQVLDMFGIRADHDLNIIEPRQTLAHITSSALVRLDSIVGEVGPDLLVVQGDTTSTFVGALAGFYHQVPVAHVEAGLRTGDVRAPYPEEMNRRLTSQLTDLHLAPTGTARDNLLREGVAPDQIVVTGNTIIDALLDVVPRTSGFGDPALSYLDDESFRVLLVTIHRRESWGEPMVGIGEALADIARAEPDVHIVIPIHRNPVVREAILPAIDGLPNVRVVEPLSYLAFVRLMQRSTLVLTDSGGIQEEAPSLGKPVLVARETTERPEAVQAGTVRLVGTDRSTIGAAALSLLRDPVEYAAMANAVNPYGDGHAAARCLDAIRCYFGEASGVAEFQPDTERS